MLGWRRLLRVENRAASRHLRGGERQEGGGLLFLVAPGNDDGPVADQENEGGRGRPRGKLQREADQAGVLAWAGRGERVAQPPDLGQEPLNFGQHLGAPGRVEIGYWLDGARPGGMPVDRRAVLVQLRVGQQVGGGIAQPAADDAAQLRGGVVQRLAAHAQGAHAASCRDNEG